MTVGREGCSRAGGTRYRPDASASAERRDIARSAHLRLLQGANRAVPPAINFPARWFAELTSVFRAMELRYCRAKAGSRAMCNHDAVCSKKGGDGAGRAGGGPYLRLPAACGPHSVPSLSVDRGMLSPFFTSASSCLPMSALLRPSTFTASSTPKSGQGQERQSGSLHGSWPRCVLRDCKAGAQRPSAAVSHASFTV